MNNPNCLYAYNVFWLEVVKEKNYSWFNLRLNSTENNPHEEEKLRKQEDELQQELISLAESRKNYSHIVSKLQKVREEQTELENNRNRVHSPLFSAFSFM